MADADSIGLADLIRRVKQELLETDAANGDGGGSTPLLMVEDVALEIKVAVSGKVNGGFDLKVVQLGAGVQRDDVHTVTVKLQPILTHEERANELRRLGRWPEIARTALLGTTKGIGSDSHKDD